MLRVRTFPVNPFSENTYVLYNEKGACWIVDPGMFDAAETEAVRHALDAENLVPKAILNTHAHIDHIFGVQALVDAYGLPFHLHRLEKPVLDLAPASAQRFGLPPVTAPQPTHWLEEGAPLDLDGDPLEVLFVPGHSPGSVAFYNRAAGWLIGGDVLFAGSIGRTDLPGGDHATLLRSIATQLLPLPDETVVYPGHGPATTIGAERRSNPFLQ